MFFENQTVEDVKKAILKSEQIIYAKKEIREHALEFDEEKFREKITKFVEKVVEDK